MFICIECFLSFQVETFGAMAKTEKIAFILEQVFLQFKILSFDVPRQDLYMLIRLGKSRSVCV